MASYCLKSADGLKQYRIAYTLDGANVRVDGCFVSGSHIVLPDGTPITPGIETPVDITHPFVDLVLNRVTASTLDDYKTLCKSLIDSSW